MLSNIASLEEFLQEKYVERYNAGDEGIKPLEYLLNDRNCSKYFQKSKKGEYAFIDASSGMKYYFINKSGLPEDVKKNLKGGDAILSNNYWASFVDVYGVTSDLKVYYCSDGKTSWMGAADEEIYTDMNTGISGMGSGSSWATTFGLDREVTLRDTMSKEILTITDSELDLNLMYNMPNLKEITFDSITRDDLDGLDNATALEKVTFLTCDIDSLNGIGNAINTKEIKFKNSKIGNYKALSTLKNLNKLYLVRPVGKNDEVADFCSSDKGIKDAEFENLKYFGITGDDKYLNLGGESDFSNWANNPSFVNYGRFFISSNQYDITDISGLAELMPKTKKAIQYLNLQNLRLTSLSAISNYENVLVLRCERNYLKTLEGIQNMSKLAFLIAKEQVLNEDYTLGSEEQATKNPLKDALSYIYLDEETGNNLNLYYLDVGVSVIKWAGYLSNCVGLNYLFLDGNLSILDASELGGVVARCGSNSYIDSSFIAKMLNPSMSTVDLNGELVTFATLETLIPLDEEGEKENNLKLKNLRLDNCIFLNSDESPITGTTLNTKLNDFLSYFPKLEVVSLSKIGDLTTIEFVKNCNSLKCVNLIGTGVLTHSGDKTQNGLELLNDLRNLNSLGLDNSAIELSDINITVKRCMCCGGSGRYTTFKNWGMDYLCLRNNALCDKLNDCTGFTGTIYFYLPTAYSFNWNLSSETGVTGVVFHQPINGTTTLPSSVGHVEVWNNGPGCLDISRLLNFRLDVGGMSLTSVQNNILNTYNGSSTIKELIIRAYAFDGYTDFSWLNKKFNNANLMVKKFTINTYTGHNTSITSLNGIQGLKELETLNIYNYIDNLTDVSKLSECPNLVLIKLCKMKIENFPNLSPVYDGEDSSKLISGCPNLKSVYLDENSLTAASIRNISNITSITTLSLNKNGLTDIYDLRDLSNLNTLSLKENLLEEWCYNSNGVRYNVCELLANMNYEKTGKTLDTGLSQLYIDGNKIEDTTDSDDEFAPLKASDVHWTDKSGF